MRRIVVAGGIDERALTLIEEAQPYNRVDDPTLHPLWVLRELSNIDKHRVLLLVAGGLAQYYIWAGLGGGGGRYFTATTRAVVVRPLEPGTELGSAGLPAEEFQKYPHVKGESSPRIAFGEGEVAALRPITDVIKELLEAVSGVIDGLRLFTLPAAFRGSGPLPEPWPQEIIDTAIARMRGLGLNPPDTHSPPP